MKTAFWLLGHAINVFRFLRRKRRSIDFSAKSFVDRAVDGEFVTDLERAVDDAIDSWHSSKSGKSLYTYLGFTWEEYTNWVENRCTIEHILLERRTKNDRG